MKTRSDRDDGFTAVLRGSGTGRYPYKYKNTNTQIQTHGFRSGAVWKMFRSKYEIQIQIHKFDKAECLSESWSKMFVLAATFKVQDSFTFEK